MQPPKIVTWVQSSSQYRLSCITHVSWPNCTLQERVSYMKNNASKRSDWTQGTRYISTGWMLGRYFPNRAATERIVDQPWERPSLILQIRMHHEVLEENMDLRFILTTDIMSGSREEIFQAYLNFICWNSDPLLNVYRKTMGVKWYNVQESKFDKQKHVFHYE